MMPTEEPRTESCRRGTSQMHWQRGGVSVPKTFGSLTVRKNMGGGWFHPFVLNKIFQSKGVTQGLLSPPQPCFLCEGVEELGPCLPDMMPSHLAPKPALPLCISNPRSPSSQRSLSLSFLWLFALATLIPAGPGLLTSSWRNLWHCSAFPCCSTSPGLPPPDLNTSKQQTGLGESVLSQGRPLSGWINQVPFLSLAFW